MQFVAAVGGLVCIYEAQPEVVLRKLELDSEEANCWPL